MSTNQDQQIQDLRAALEQAKAETLSVRKSLADAQQKLSAASPVSLFSIKRSHIALPASQIPDCEELARIAHQKDASITALRSGQYEVIRSILENKDCAAFMPTGGGKSLIWLLHNCLSTEIIKKKGVDYCCCSFYGNN